MTQTPTATSTQERAMSEPARQQVTPVREAALPASEPASIIAVIERAALNPDVDVDKMERLYAMHERAMERQARAAFAAALAEMQPKLPVIDERGGIKDRAGKVQSTYARWEDISDAIRPILHEHGFALSFRVVTTPKVAVTGVLTHRDGHREETTMELPVDGSGSKNDVQAVGSSFSYGKRYTAIALLNITSRAAQDRDDDGRAGGMSKDAQAAISDINMAENLIELRRWKAEKYDWCSKNLPPHELKEVIALYNTRLKKMREGAPPSDGGVSDFPGDR